MKTVLERLDAMPPALCRLVARRPKGSAPEPVTSADIAQESGLSAQRVTYLSGLMTWADVPVKEVDAFRQGCGLRPDRLAHAKHYIRWQLGRSKRKPPEKPFAHLSRLPKEQADIITAALRRAKT